jgi:hypothetical protein
MMFLQPLQGTVAMVAIGNELNIWVLLQLP